MKKLILNPARILFVSLSLLWLAGCSTVPEQKEPIVPAMHPVEDVVKSDVNYVVDVYDPWEPMNRRIYNFNTHFDRYIFLPVVSAYEFILPVFVQDGVSNFFSNLGEITNFTNSVFQLKPKPALTSVGRFAINTTIGLLGVWDPAKKMGIHQWDEDFGQTLGHYGVGDGPFLVLPFLGPSNLRDTTGLIADTATMTAIDPLQIDDGHAERSGPYYILNAIDTRHQTKFRYWETGSPFEYELVRLLYGKARELQIAK